MQTFEQRQQHIGQPKGWTPAGEPGKTRITDATIEVEWQEFARPFRQVERHAVVMGSERTKRITADPGERVQYTLNHVAGGLSDSVSIDFGLIYRETERTGYTPLAAGFYDLVSGPKDRPSLAWPAIFDTFGTTRHLQGVDPWAAFVKALDRGFKAADLEVAFGDDAPLAQLRAAAKAAVHAHVDALALPDRMPYFTRVAQAGILESFDVGLLGPYVADEFGRQLDQRFSDAPIDKLAQLVDQLTK